MRPILLLSILVIALGACAYTPPKDVNSPYYKVPVGSTLILKHPIEIPADVVAVGLASAGDPPRAVHPYQRDTGCELEMWSKIPETRTLQPGIFEVIKVVQDIEYVQREPVRLAGVSFGIGVGIGDGGVGMSVGSSGAGDPGPAWEIHSAVLYLRSRNYPDVYRVTCDYRDNVSEGMPLSITTIRWALGGDFDLQLPEAPAAAKPR
jgi:hypothetical protein